ncbi:MAG: CotH kinase family protein [Saprospiraceae bacterium]|nr:CotH kinase family protein [Saprospiraceae bacterium]MDZ4703774.1 CotH kinase family protein [Saprospiraceae bacterium]
MKKHLFLSALSFLFAIQVPAQVIINEFSASNKSDFADNFGDFEDWVELHNTSASAVNLEGWYLSDDPDDPEKYQFPNISIPAGGFQVVFCSDRDVIVGQNVHTSFKLTQTKQESIVLSDAGGNVVSSVQMTAVTQSNHSRGRKTDGSNIWAVFADPTPGQSNNPATDYVAYAPKPVFTTVPGFYYPSAGMIQVIIQNPLPGFLVRYTTDGAQPTAASTEVTGSITVDKTTVIRARTFSIDPSILPSFSETNTYFIDETHTMPVVSLASRDFDDLFSGFGGEISNYIEYFEDGILRFELQGDIRGHGNDSWAYDQKGMRFYARDEYGYDNNIEYKIFETTPRDEFDVIILKAGASDNYPGGVFDGIPSTHIRDAFAHTLSEKGQLDLDFRRLQHCIVYINGEYWGLYECRERVDTDYTNFYYNQGEKNVDMLKFWGGMDVENGSPQPWYDVYDFILNNDINVPANYEYVKSQISISSFIDYFILNTFLVNSDWLNWNTMWWRGTEGAGVPWRYALWDMDNICDLGQNYTGLSTTTFENSPCNVEDFFANDPGIAHTGMWKKFFDNPAFVQQYVNRYADLMNTLLNCDFTLSHLDSLVAIITPEMPRQINRWGGSMQEWQENLEYLRSQVEGKCTLLAEQIVDCYEDEGITGPYTIEVDVVPAGTGRVKFNTTALYSYPYSATYFGGIGITCEALPNADQIFDHWEIDGIVFSPDEFTQLIEFSLTNDATITAFFEPAIPCIQPYNIFSDSTYNSIALNWTGPNNFIAYEVSYRPLGATAWETFANLEANYLIEDLSACTAYEIRLRSFCGFATSVYDTVVVQTQCFTGTHAEGDGLLASARAFPNPFSQGLSVEVELSAVSPVAVELHSANGQLIQVEAKEQLQAGLHRFEVLSENNLPGGLYLLKIRTEDGVKVIRVVKGM